MKLNVIFRNARCAVLECADGSIFYLDQPAEVFVNGEKKFDTDHVIFSLYGLAPQTMYHVELKRDGSLLGEALFTTEYEFVTLNVNQFGAKGDGVSDDTHFIQAAIMACPKNSRVLIPKGTYRITSLFLKDDLNLELESGATLLAYTDRERFPVFPPLVQSYDERGEYILGTWEGNPLPMFSGIITGINVKNVVIYGGGILDGQASFEEGRPTIHLVTDQIDEKLKIDLLAPVQEWLRFNIKIGNHNIHFSVNDLSVCVPSNKTLNINSGVFKMSSTGFKCDIDGFLIYIERGNAPVLAFMPRKLQGPNFVNYTTENSMATFIGIPVSNTPSFTGA